MLTKRQKEIATKLLLLGVAPQNKGYAYALTAINLAIDDPTLTNSMCKGLYQEVSVIHKVDWRNVERCLRTAIKNAWETGHPEFWQQEFGRYPKKAAPTNANFTAVLAQRIILSQAE